MRLLGLDFGAARIGVALTDPGRRIASPHSVFAHRGYGPSAQTVHRLLKETGSEYVVLGLPLNMDGSRGAQAAETLGFAEALRKRGLRVELQDERQTSLEAESSLRDAGKTWQQAKALVDQVAAALILQAYLDERAAHPPNSHPGRGASISFRRKPSMAHDHNHKDELPEELESNIVELTDEEGQTTEFEYLTTIEHKGESYVVLLAPQEEENDEEGEVVILKIQQDENGEDTYVSCENDEVEQEIFELFMEELDEEDDAEYFEEQEGQ